MVFSDSLRLDSATLRGSAAKRSVARWRRDLIVLLDQTDLTHEHQGHEALRCGRRGTWRLDAKSRVHMQVQCRVSSF